MGLFDLFKSKKTTQEESKSSSILLAMPMFLHNETLDPNKVKEHLEKHWKLSISDFSINDSASTFYCSGELIAIGLMPAPIPSDDIKNTAQYAYNWPEAWETLQHHTGHAIVSIMSSSNSPLSRFQLFTKVLQSIVATSNSVGVYIGTQSLLIPRDQFLSSAEALQHGKIPLDLWIYIGIRQRKEGNSLYTYGLKEFNKLEMEIIDSKEKITELFEFISNVSAYVISSDISFNSGETFGYTAEQKIKITQSKAVWIEGESFKLGL